MDRLKALGRGTQIMFIAAVLLLIDSFFRWQEVEFDLGALGSGSAGQNAWHGFFGVVMGILTIVLIARLAARLAAVEVPIPLSFATTSFVLGVLIAICGVLKVLTDDYRTFWAWLGAALAIVVAVGAWLEVQEAGGIEHLRSQIPESAGSAAPAAEAPGPAPEAAAPPPAAPAPPAQEMTGDAGAGTGGMEEPASAAPSEPAQGAAEPAAPSDEPSTERES